MLLLVNMLCWSCRYTCNEGAVRHVMDTLEGKHILDAAEGTNVDDVVAGKHVMDAVAVYMSWLKLQVYM